MVNKFDTELLEEISAAIAVAYNDQEGLADDEPLNVQLDFEKGVVNLRYDDMLIVVHLNQFDYSIIVSAERDQATFEEAKSAAEFAIESLYQNVTK